MRKLTRSVYWILCVFVFVIGVAANTEASNPDCAQACCWHWLWGYQSTCNATCPEGQACQCTCSCEMCDCNCTIITYGSV